MSDKHTPGPWHLIDHAFPGRNHRDRSIVDDHGNTIVAVLGEGVADCIRDANAKLLASAPSLLAACKAQEDALNKCIRYFLGTGLQPDPEDFTDVTTQACAAIRKAEGV